MPKILPIKFLRFQFIKKSVTTRILVSLILTNLVLLLILGMMIIHDSSDTLTHEIINYTSKVMNQACNNLDFNFEDIKTPFALLTANASVIACLDSYQSMSWIQRLEHERNIHEIASNINTFKPLISDILIIGKNGYITNLSEYRSTLLYNYNFWDQSWYKKAIAVNQEKRLRYLGLHFQDYYLPKLTYKYMKPTFSMAIPVYNNNNNITGAVICNFDIDKLNNILTQSNFERSGQILLLDKAGIIIAHKKKALVGHIFKLPGRRQLLHQTAGHFITTFQGKRSLLIFQTSKVTGWKIVSYIPLSEIYNHSGLMKRDITLILLFGLILNIVICVFIVFNIGKPLKQLIASIDNVNQNNLHLSKLDYRYSELNFVSGKFGELLERINALIRENYETQVSLKDAELKALQSQINPHFIFNTLQLLQTEILYNRFEISNQIILSLSRMLRYTVYESHALVAIKTEIAYVKDYLLIYSHKFRDKLRVNYQIPEAIESYLIPKLLLQPIIENSLKHGFFESPKAGQIDIAINPHSQGLLISIRDNGIGIESGKLQDILNDLNQSSTINTNIPSPHVGLSNVQQRIKKKYGEDYGLTMMSEVNLYTQVDLLIPALLEEKNIENTDC